MDTGRRLPQVLLVVGFIFLALATLHERHATKPQFDGNSNPQFENSHKTGEDEALNQLPAVHGPAAPNVALLPLAEHVGIRGQQLHAAWAFARLPAFRAPPVLRSPIVV